MKRSEKIIFAGIVAVFIVLHIFGLSQPYHQDEYKWPIIVNPQLTEPGGIPHPPVGEFIYRQAGFLVGYDNFRLIPSFFGFINLLLLFYLVKNIFDTKTALWSAGIFTFSFYSLLASLMVDTDGAIMPFFFLLMTIGYYKLRVTNYEVRGSNLKWFIILILAAVLGFLVKASFIIGIGALVFDFMFEKGVFSDKKKVLKYFALGAGLIVLFVGLLFLVQFVFPYFRLEWTLKYWSHFIKFSGRGWMQTFIQFVKACFYLSPFLVLAPLFLAREEFRKVRPFVLFITLGLLFYLVLFDFSGGALDRYFQFLVLPLSIIAGSVCAKNFELKNRNVLPPLFIGVVVYFLQFFNHYVPPLHPKSEWIGRILSLEWDFLYPFSGGSGPLGFYVSFALIGLFWIASFVFVLQKVFNNFGKKNDKAIVVGLLVFGIFYNLVFIQEYLFGFINGYTPRLVGDAATFIKSNDDIKRVVVYNDNGGYEIRKTGKYERRLYATPQFEDTYRDFFKNYSGHILYINIPRIGENNFYSNYLENDCKRAYQRTSGRITSVIYDCLN